MVNPISSYNSAGKKTPDADQALAKPVAQPEVNAKSDLVQISDAAQAKLFRQEGLTVDEIAIKMGLDVKTVSTFLPSPSLKG